MRESKEIYVIEKRMMYCVNCLEEDRIRVIEF